MRYVERPRQPGDKVVIPQVDLFNGTTYPVFGWDGEFWRYLAGGPPRRVLPGPRRKRKGRVNV